MDGLVIVATSVFGLVENHDSAWRLKRLAKANGLLEAGLVAVVAQVLHAEFVALNLGIKCDGPLKRLQEVCLHGRFLKQCHGCKPLSYAVKDIQLELVNHLTHKAPRSQHENLVLQVIVGTDTAQLLQLVELPVLLSFLVGAANKDGCTLGINPRLPLGIEVSQTQADDYTKQEPAPVSPEHSQTKQRDVQHTIAAFLFFYRILVLNNFSHFFEIERL